MPPKAAKKDAEKREKIAVDKTFGMKNKNKSKVVQKYIKQIQQNVAGVSSRTTQAEKKEKDAKEAAMQSKALMASLFNMQTDKKGRAFDPKAKKAAKEAEENAIAAGKKLNDEIKKSIIEGIANTIRLTNPKTGIRMSEMGGHPIIHALKDKHADTFRTIQLLLFIKANDRVFWVDNEESTNPMIRCQEDVDAEVGPDERSLEEIIEEKRKELTGPGTPITEETFKAWKAKKEAERLAQLEKEKAEKSKNAKSKGNNAMSGRDLFTYDASLFVDDDEAADDKAYEDREDRLESDEEGDDDDESGPDEEAVEESAGSKAVAIDQNLFLGEADDVDDLDDLDDD